MHDYLLRRAATSETMNPGPYFSIIAFVYLLLLFSNHCCFHLSRVTCGASGGARISCQWCQNLKETTMMSQIRIYVVNYGAFIPGSLLTIVLCSRLTTWSMCSSATEQQTNFSPLLFLHPGSTGSSLSWTNLKKIVGRFKRRFAYIRF